MMENRPSNTVAGSVGAATASHESLRVDQEASGRVHQPLRRLGILLINVWLILHLVAIVSAPATVGPSSQTARTIWSALSPYLETLHLNHGYHYFAPEPGSSHLVSWTAIRQDGSMATGTFPNPDIQPRLMYHRHFMLSEFLGNADPELREILASGFARHLHEKLSHWMSL